MTGPLGSRARRRRVRTSACSPDCWTGTGGSTSGKASPRRPRCSASLDRQGEHRSPHVHSALDGWRAWPCHAAARGKQCVRPSRGNGEARLHRSRASRREATARISRALPREEARSPFSTATARPECRFRQRRMLMCLSKQPGHGVVSPSSRAPAPRVRRAGKREHIKEGHDE